MQIVIGLQIGNQSTGVGGDPTVGVKLQIFVQPAGAIAGVVFGTQPVVRCLTSGNTLDTSFTGSITLTKISGPGSMNGTQTIVAVAGVATFTNLSIDTAGDCVLQATSSGKTSADTNSFTVAPAYAVDLILMPTGTNDALVTVASLTAGEIGSTTGWSAFSLSRTPMQHTRVRSTAEVRRNYLRVGGAAYDGTGYKTIESDLTLALSNGSSPLYEFANITTPSGKTSATYTWLLKFSVTTGANDVNFDVFEANFGGVARLQISSKFNGDFWAYIHTGVGNGALIIINNTDWYSCTLNVDYASQYAQILLVNNSTGDVVGTSEIPLTVTGQGLLVWDGSYLLTTFSGGGKITRGLLGVDFTNAAFPLETITVPIPTGFGVSESPSGSALLGWTSLTQRIKIERRVNGGAWSTLESSYDSYIAGHGGQYTDSGLTTGSTYDYRIYSLVGSLESSASTTESVTIGGGGAGLVAHTSEYLGANGGTTTSPQNTTGANLIVVAGQWFIGSGGAPALSDSYGNTWIPLTPQSSVGLKETSFYYCYNPTVGAGHTFTFEDVVHVCYPGVSVLAFSGSASSPFDQENGGSDAHAPSISSGSITPSQSNSVVVTSVCSFGDMGSSSISGFSIEDNLAQTEQRIAWVAVTSAAPINATWNLGNSPDGEAAIIANFKT